MQGGFSPPWWQRNDQHTEPAHMAHAFNENQKSEEARRTYLKASSKVHSDLVVGLDRGKMMGRWLMAAISRRTSSLKLPAMVDTPGGGSSAGGTLPQMALTAAIRLWLYRAE
eukprot:1160013-Pelagomonas_calceolata.AAC.5